MLRFTRIILLLCVSFLLSARVDKEKVQAFVAKHGLATGLSSAVYTNFIVAGEKKIKSLGERKKLLIVLLIFKISYIVCGTCMRLL